MSTSYRPDIDGLRSIAVLSVLCYHGFPQALPGGFVGVDIFFVISGFLITGIILSGMRDGTFTFADFYARRVRRIFPALSLVLATTLFAGVFILLPLDFRGLGVQVAAGAGFVSNLALWHESGYFDTASELKPLLHLWSLGIEEQYYAVWPVLLVLVNRRWHRILPLVILIAAISFALNIYLIDRRPSAVFYSPPTRFWELMIGSSLAYITTFRAQLSAAMHVRGNILATVGITLVIIALAFTRESHFPGWWALLPTFGAVLIIAGGPGSIVGRALGYRLLVYVGLISYPLYLWHWPLLTYARIIYNDLPPAPVRLAMLAVSVLLADLTYRFLEKKLRRPSMRWAVTGLAGSMIGVTACGALAIVGRIQPASASTPHMAELAAAISDWDAPREWTPGDSSRVVMFFGDSFAEQYWPRVPLIERQHIAPTRSVVFHTLGGCAPIVGINRPGNSCDTFAATGYTRAQQPDVEIVVFACAWVGFYERTDYYDITRPGDPPLKLRGPSMDVLLRRFQDALSDLRSRGKRLVIVLSSPVDTAFDPGGMIHRQGWFNWSVQLSDPVPRSKVEARRAPIEDRIQRIAREVGATVVDPLDWVCSKKWCPTLDSDGRPLYKDEDHFRAMTVRDRVTALDQYVYLSAVTESKR